MSKLPPPKPPTDKKPRSVAGVRLQSLGARAVGTQAGALGWLGLAWGQGGNSRALGGLAVRLQADATASLAAWPLMAVLGLPVGILVYFQLPILPPWWLGFLPLVFSGAVLVLVARAPRLLWVGPLAWALLWFALAFLACAARIAQLDAAKLEKPVFAQVLTGRVLSVEQSEEGYHLYVRPSALGALPLAQLPVKIRVKVPPSQREQLQQAGLEIAAGQDWRMKVSVWPPPPPVLPRGLDVQRLAYFQQLGGYGRLLALPEPISDATAAPTPLWERIWQKGQTTLSQYRRHIESQLIQRYGNDQGGVMAALLVGRAQAISETMLESIRLSGLAHLLAISGLHMGMVTALCFLLLRSVILLLAPHSVSVHGKKLAAVASLVPITLYLLISGASLPTQRAYIMSLLALIAIAMDRRILSARLLAIAGVLVLAFKPEALLTPSFQMSFSAVAGLIAFGRIIDPLFSPWRLGFASRHPWLVTVLARTGSLASTSLVATLATGPLVLATFNRLPLAGLASNLIAVPLMGMWILPLGLLGLVLEPFGLGSLGFEPMRWGVSLMLDLARWCADLPFTTLTSATPHPLWLPLAALGLWLGLIAVGALRMIGGALLLFSLIAGLLSPALPRVLVTQDGRSLAVFEQGQLWVLRGSVSSFAVQQWQQSLGWPETHEASLQDLISGQMSAARMGLVCDPDGCVFRGKATIAFPAHTAAAMQDCQRADLVIAPGLSLYGCGAAHVDYRRLQHDGATRIWQVGDRLQRETLRARGGLRPWSNFRAD